MKRTVTIPLKEYVELKDNEEYLRDKLRDIKDIIDSLLL